MEPLIDDRPHLSRISIFQAESSSEIAVVRELFVEYAESLGFTLCFQNFDRELVELPGDYTPPAGRLLLVLSGSQPAGCVALHSLETGICEIKRLYVRPQFRGTGLGKMLTNTIISAAKGIGYKKVRLDTVEPKMKTAVGLYRALGFREIAPYRPNPIEGAMYMEMEL
jgi:putative acetyltransferase